MPARTAACCGPPGGHKGRPYEGERLATPSIWLTRSTSIAIERSNATYAQTHADLTNFRQVDDDQRPSGVRTPIHASRTC